MAEDLGNERIADSTLKGIVVGFMDPMTRAHTAMEHGAITLYTQLKDKVLQFANNASPIMINQHKDVDMQANAMQQGNEDPWNSGGDPWAGGRGWDDGSGGMRKTRRSCGL